MLPHAVFLERAAREPLSSPAVSYGQGAFLALRLLDLLGPDGGSVEAEAFEYQCAATDRFCRSLRNGSTEAAHLQEIVRSTAEAQRRRDPRLVAPGLLAYAHHLEDDAHYEESLDVLQTMLRVGGEGLVRSDIIAARLRIARLNRKLARFDEAEQVYEAAGALASAAGDGYSVLLSRLGGAETLRGRGNLAGAETCLREILADARSERRREAEALAEHGLGPVLYMRGQIPEAATHVWRAFKLYEDEGSRVRALSDLGIMLRTLGQVDAAERAFEEVVRRSAGYDQDTNAMIELLECASRRGDRLTFERRREECRAREPRMAPNMHVDFYFKQGLGQARFGEFTRALTSLQKARELAAEAGLHEFEFRIERIRNGLRDCEQQLARAPLEVAEPVARDSLEEVRRSLIELTTTRV